MQLGDARTGKLADNLTGFGRALRRAGVQLDSARIGLAQQGSAGRRGQQAGPGGGAGIRAGQP